MRRITTTRAIASTLLSITLALGGVPATALAQEDAVPETSQEEAAAPAGVDTAALDDALADGADAADDAAFDDVADAAEDGTDAADDADVADGAVMTDDPEATDDEGAADDELSAEGLAAKPGAEAEEGELSAEASTPHVVYRTHVQTYGNQAWKQDGAMSGTSGKSKRLEGIWIKLTNAPYSGGIQYRTHVQTYGWQGWRANGKMSGTSGKSKRLEAIQIKLTGEMAKHYSVIYRVHAQRFGWMAWAKDGAQSGTAGFGYRLEGIEIRIVPKSYSLARTTKTAYARKTASTFETDDYVITFPKKLRNKYDIKVTSDYVARRRGSSAYNYTNVLFQTNVRSGQHVYGGYIITRTNLTSQLSRYSYGRSSRGNYVVAGYGAQGMINLFKSPYESAVVSVRVK